MIKLRYTVPEDEGGYTAIRSVDMCVDCEQELDDIIEAFSDFLKSCGYRFAEIKLVNEQETKARDDIALNDMMEALNASAIFDELEAKDKVKIKEQVKRSIFL
tara:strand:- start:388 stop:696 length:309 start_codon:yes stop_codon:yes gene_type:complete